MEQTTFSFVGLGLIGGSIAKAIRNVYKENAIIYAYDTNEATLKQATDDDTINLGFSALSEDFCACDYLFLCTQVSENASILKQIQNYISPACLITDVGSVKSEMHQQISALHLDKNFIGGHPMAGSEKSGYKHSSARILENAYYILTPTKEVSPDLIASYQKLVTSFGAIPLILSCEEHDYITAAVSHLPHIIASSLVNLIQDSDSKDGFMKLIAAGGFKDITRIASSSPFMWQQICLTNQPNISKLLEDYIQSLQAIQQNLQTENADSLYTLFDSARNYRDSFQDISSGPLKKVYGFYVDIPDETGVISTIATLLAKENINIKNIGIIHNREFEEGVLRIEFYEDSVSKQASLLLSQCGYTIYQRH